MGCSASHAIIANKGQQYTTNVASSSSSSSSSHSQHAYSDCYSTPVSRTLSLPTPLIHHPPLREGDSNHLVCLTSTTYGSLVLVDPVQDHCFDGQDLPNSTTQVSKSRNMSDSHDPLSPDSVINTWELMEGLDEMDFDIIDAPKKPDFPIKSKSFDSGYFKKESEVNELVKSYEIVEHGDTKPLWQHLSGETMLANIEPDVASCHRQALWPKGSEQSELKGDAKEKELGCLKPDDKTSLSCRNEFYLPGGEDRIVLYYTSLRGIRKTYEDCCEVRLIFKGFRVFVDERDTSMDSSYRKELQDVLIGKAVSLPEVFIRGKYIGGADKIKQLHEAGDLAKLLDGFPLKDHAFACERCGDAGFVPCLDCNGSRKVYEENEGKLRRCPQCNENGLIRCPSCYP